MWKYRRASCLWNDGQTRNSRCSILSVEWCNPAAGVNIGGALHSWPLLPQSAAPAGSSHLTTARIEAVENEPPKIGGVRIGKKLYLLPSYLFKWLSSRKSSCFNCKLGMSWERSCGEKRSLTMDRGIGDCYYAGRNLILFAQRARSIGLNFLLYTLLSAQIIAITSSIFKCKSTGGSFIRGRS